MTVRRVHLLVAGLAALCSGGAPVTPVAAWAATAAEAWSSSCLSEVPQEPARAVPGGIAKVLHFDGKQAIQSEDGWYEALVKDELVKYRPIRDSEFGGVLQIQAGDGGRYLLWGPQGWALAELDEAGHVVIRRVSGPLPSGLRQPDYLPLRGVGWVVVMNETFFLVRAAAKKVVLEPIPGEPPAERGILGSTEPDYVPGLGPIFQTAGGASVLKVSADSARLEPLTVGALGRISYIRGIPGVGFLVMTKKGWFPSLLKHRA